MPGCADMSAQVTVSELEALTEKQRLFVVEYVSNGANMQRACDVAGYSKCSIGYDAVKLPHVQAAISAMRSLVIDTELATLGLGVMKALLKDEKTPSHVRFQAARYALGLAGHCEALPRSQDDTKTKALADMTLDELKEYVAKGKVILDALPAAQVREIETSPPGKAATVPGGH